MIRKAQHTYDKINAMLEADQGSAYRYQLGLVLPHIGDAYRTGEDGHRSHMGASVIGGECGRAIWYGFRWATKSRFPGRILRLFNRGHLEEGRIIALLLMIGCEVYQQDANGNQYRISDANGHFGGSGDGVVIGLPDLPPGTPALCEFKTHGSKSFAELEKKGMRGAKFEHYVQMNVYMYKMGLSVGLYVAVNKDTDELWMEIVPVDFEIAEQFVDRGRVLTHMTTPPKRISESPGFFKCKWCDHKSICHGLGAVPDHNCRTCEFATLGQGPGEWVCNKHLQVIGKELQLTGCEDYQVKKDF